MFPHPAEESGLALVLFVYNVCFLQPSNIRHTIITITCSVLVFTLTLSLWLNTETPWVSSAEFVIYFLRSYPSFLCSFPTVLILSFSSFPNRNRKTQSVHVQLLEYTYLKNINSAVFLNTNQCPAYHGSFSQNQL